VINIIPLDLWVGGRDDYDLDPWDIFGHGVRCVVAVDTNPPPSKFMDRIKSEHVDLFVQWTPVDRSDPPSPAVIDDLVSSRGHALIVGRTGADRALALAICWMLVHQPREGEYSQPNALAKWAAKWAVGRYEQQGNKSAITPAMKRVIREYDKACASRSSNGISEV
jgi:hypothetical protein